MKRPSWFTRPSGARPKPDASRRRARPSVESLGDRVLLTVGYNGVNIQPVTDGVAVIGTPGDDTFNINFNYSTQTLFINARNAAGSISRHYPVSDLSRFDLAIWGMEGNDRLVASDATKIRISAWGGAGNDNLLGGSNNDRLYGEAGDDVIAGGRGDDLLDGGDGNDTLGAVWQAVGVVSPEPGNDTLVGGHGNDSLGGGAGHDTLDGGEGHDTLRGDDGNDVLRGGNGNDQLGLVVLLSGEIRRTEHGDDLLYGGEGADMLRGGDGNDALYGENGDDLLGAILANGKFVGDDGNDVLHGGNGNDQIGGGEGNDTLEGGFGDDLMSGGRGDDSFRFASTRYLGRDTLTEPIGGGTDTLDFSEASPGITISLLRSGYQQVIDGHSLSIQGGEFENVIGSSGKDWIEGSLLANRLDARGGDDTIVGHDGDDVILGGDGNDLIYGLAGNDYVFGGRGDDVILGGDGNDYLYGDAGNDAVRGDEGDDYIIGGDGHDVLGATVVAGETGGYYTGWQGTFFIEPGDDVILGGDGNDVIGGGDDDDYLSGDDGDDVIVGGDGDDGLYGGDGEDYLNGELHTDHYDAGAGQDRIAATDNVAETIYTGGGNDTVGCDTFDGTNPGEYDDVYYSDWEIGRETLLTLWDLVSTIAGALA